MKRRVLDIEYDVKKAYLELDTEKVLGRYTRSMSSDIELFRAFGSVNEREPLTTVQNDLNRIREYLDTREVDAEGNAITPERRLRDVKAHETNGRIILQDLQHSIDRLRGFAGMPKDPGSVWYRMGRAAMNLNVSTMMGSAAITSVPDLARTVMAHGMMNTFREAWIPMIRALTDETQLKANQAWVEQLRQINIGMEIFTQSRAQGTLDIVTDIVGPTRLERGLEWLAQKTPQIALFGPWTDFMKLTNGLIAGPRLLRAISDIAEGKMQPGSPELAWTTGLGIDPILANRIYAQYTSPEGSVLIGNTRIPQMDKWRDYEALRAFAAALVQDTDSVIITPGLERPRWMDSSPLGRIIGQFRSFTMASHSKILISGLQQRNMALFHFLEGTMFSLALGALSYYIWANTAGERQREEMRNAGWDVWIDQAIYRSGVLGALSEVQSIGSTIPATAPYVTFRGSALAGRRPTSTLGAVFGPSFGTAETIASVLQGMDEPTQGTLSQARKLIPYQNVFYLREALTLVEEGAAAALGLPESRR